MKGSRHRHLFRVRLHANRDKRPLVVKVSLKMCTQEAAKNTVPYCAVIGDIFDVWRLTNFFLF
jgi:hypothetical protein